MTKTIFVGGERGTCGCQQLVTNLGDRLKSRWVHDGGAPAHKPFAITAVSR